MTKQEIAEALRSLDLPLKNIQEQTAAQVRAFSQAEKIPATIHEIRDGLKRIAQEATRE